MHTGTNKGQNKGGERGYKPRWEQGQKQGQGMKAGTVGTRAQAQVQAMAGMRRSAAAANTSSPPAVFEYHLRYMGESVQPHFLA
jgi:hypothetical protein